MANTTQTPQPPKFPVPRNNPNNKPQKPSSSRFGGSSSGSRFGSSRFGSREEVKWTVTSPKSVAVRISLDGLGDPLHRLLGQPINMTYSKVSSLADALAADPDLAERVATALDEAWANLNFRGAAFLYNWDDRIREAFTQPPEPLPPQPPKKDEGEDDSTDDDDTDDFPAWLAEIGISSQPAQQLRAIDVAFVMNILARTRAGVLVGNTPLALEQGFLETTVICDDPRIIELARATGCIDEKW